jgi:hypothetical protein
MTSPPLKKHDRSSFFKYMSAYTTLTVIKNGTLRWSSPIEFNDPFDVPRELAFDIDPSEIKNELSNYLIDLIQNKSKETSHLNPALKLIINQARNGSKDIKEEIIEVIKCEAIKKVTDSHSMEELREMWRQLISEFRILCLCESPRTVSMWYHYAGKYSGAVIEFACNEDSDSPWLLAKKIDYPETIPDIFTPKGWAKLITMPVRNAIENLLNLYTYIKTPDWSYEKEWRLVSFKRPHETGTVSDYKINRNDLSAVYLGPLMNSNDRGQIISILKDRMSHVKIFQAEIGMNRRFEFKPIKI